MHACTLAPQLCKLTPHLQDQLVLQMIRLMDRLLKKENLDLRLTPYGCLAASSTIGMLEKIESVAVAKINSTSSISV